MSTITVGTNTYSLVTMPTDPPCPNAVEWMNDDNNGINVSPFTFQQQVYNWGQARLQAKLSYQPMTHTQARAWVAFLAALRGKMCVFQFADGKSGAPLGTGGTGTVSGANQTGFNLVTSFSGAALLPGDWIQIGYRAYLVTSNSGGTLGIYPNIRESPANAASITTSNVKGLYRLAKNQRRFAQGVLLYNFTDIEIEEAL